MPETAVGEAAGQVYVDAAPLADGQVLRLYWGGQVDARTITEGADRDRRSARVVIRSRSAPTWPST